MPKAITDPRLLLARSMKEEGPGGLREQVELLASQCGYVVRHIRDSRRQNVSDLPDLFLIRRGLPGRTMWVELKREGKRPTPGQDLMMTLMGRAGLEVYLVHPSDLLAGTVLALLRGIGEKP